MLDIPIAREELTSHEEGEVPDSTTHNVTVPSSPRATQEDYSRVSNNEGKSLRRIYDTCNFVALESENYE